MAGMNFMGESGEFVEREAFRSGDKGKFPFKAWECGIGVDIGGDFSVIVGRELFEAEIRGDFSVIRLN
ncbi:hypothetical protein M3649_02120 [Ureibacillus chungkukjangi]|uniref:hypothetical protein n=1 Tax=Ureibacillus chungkukjangi TaxID=1202712 RepID=UPI00204102B9|nr:hypothetical protein [Ureibacillus chungkukjangi]MCM3386924.1 hypothetical protein [Ureibacillus chungkukjangi]